jgi:hypothetical protein
MGPTNFLPKKPSISSSFPKKNLIDDVCLLPLRIALPPPPARPTSAPTPTVEPLASSAIKPLYRLRSCHPSPCSRLLHRALHRPCLLQKLHVVLYFSSSLHAPHASTRAARVDVKEEREYGALRARGTTTIFACLLVGTVGDATVAMGIGFSQCEEG